MTLEQIVGASRPLISGRKMALLILIGNWLGAWSDCTDSWKLTEQTGTTWQLGTRGLSGKEEIPGILEQVGIYSC